MLRPRAARLLSLVTALVASLVLVPVPAHAADSVMCLWKPYLLGCTEAEVSDGSVRGMAIVSRVNRDNYRDHRVSIHRVALQRRGVR